MWLWILSALIIVLAWAGWFFLGIGLGIPWLWPAIVKLSRHFRPEQLAQVRQEHTASGRHVNHLTAYPAWVPAEVLEEAGCDNEEILAHLRGEGPHVRGCWVVDAVLGKA